MPIYFLDPTENIGKVGGLYDSCSKIIPTTYLVLFPLDMLIFHLAFMKDAWLILKSFIIFCRLLYLVYYYSWPFLNIRKIEHEGKVNWN